MYSPPFQERIERKVHSTQHVQLFKLVPPRARCDCSAHSLFSSQSCNRLTSQSCNRYTSSQSLSSLALPLSFFTLRNRSCRCTRDSSTRCLSRFRRTTLASHQRSSLRHLATIPTSTSTVRDTLAQPTGPLLTLQRSCVHAPHAVPFSHRAQICTTKSITHYGCATLCLDT
jgi:hypothetical protein